VSRAACLTRILVAAATLAVAGCGSGDDRFDPGAFRPQYAPPADSRPGGTLRVLASGDIDSLDPGAAQNQFAFMVAGATQRTLLASSPRPGGSPIPDLADGPPKIDPGTGTVEFKIRSGIRYSPPVDREVEAGDFKYAIERALLPGVSNGYVDAYLGDLVGFGQAREAARLEPEVAPDIAGITAPDDRTLRLRFRGDVPPLAVDVLSLPIGAPVPASYARRFDAEIPSSYGGHVVGTGPYMVPADAEGNLTGFRPGVETELVRNPNWRRTTDFRPAYLDRILIENGYGNTASASRKILGGEAMVNGDFSPDPTLLRYAATERPSQLVLVPAGASLYASLNTTVPPLDDPDVRRAIVAASDRIAMRLVRGGRLIGPLATHFIPPGVPGFEKAGGYAGPDFAFLAHPHGSAKTAAAYMRRAGYPDGRYSGDDELLMVTDSTGIGRRVGEVVRDAVESLGIPVTTRSVTRDVMFSRYCNVPRAEVAICPNVGWVRQIDDAQAVLAETFGGGSIRQVNNSNWPQLSDPVIDLEMNRAEWITGRRERATAWARIDRRVTGLAPAIPSVWAQIPLIHSDDVRMVVDRVNANPSLTMTSLAEAGG